MKKLPHTQINVAFIKAFIDETKRRITSGVNLTFSKKASTELDELIIEYDITIHDIESAILNLGYVH